MQFLGSGRGIGFSFAVVTGFFGGLIAAAIFVAPRIILGVLLG